MRMQIDQLNLLHDRQFVSRWILSILRRACVMTARDGSDNIWYVTLVMTQYMPTF